MDRPTYHGAVTNLFPGRHEGVSVDILDNLPAGGRTLKIRLAHQTNDDATGVTFADLCPDNARALAVHLINAAAIADRNETAARAGLFGARRLPTATLCGEEFYIDDRLRQLRSVEAPIRFIDLGRSETARDPAVREEAHPDRIVFIGEGLSVTFGRAFDGDDAECQRCGKTLRLLAVERLAANGGWAPVLTLCEADFAELAAVVGRMSAHLAGR